jgi:hypothetical protein
MISSRLSSWSRLLSDSGPEEVEVESTYDGVSLCRRTVGLRQTEREREREKREKRETEERREKRERKGTQTRTVIQIETVVVDAALYRGGAEHVPGYGEEFLQAEDLGPLCAKLGDLLYHLILEHLLFVCGGIGFKRVSEKES